MLKIAAFVFLLDAWANAGIYPASSFAAPITPDWSSNVSIPLTGRPNPYGWDNATLAEKIRLGRLDALNYPVVVTGTLMPAAESFKILDLKPGDPLFGLMKTVLGLNHDFKDFSGFWNWLGLHDYPDSPDPSVPYPGAVKPNYPMGVSIIRRYNADGFSLSCAACHSANLFGKRILGMTNRFSRANEFFILGKKSLATFGADAFAVALGATAGEKQMYAEARDSIQSVGVKKPATLGLDTSLAQVALSLARRAHTPDAERTEENAKNPRPDLLDNLVADSKPAVWWNLKYKTRWLSDGSIVSGNPVFTNFLWNEIGRGGDLPPLENWLDQNQSIVEELTTAAFATEAPKYKDFFGADSIQVTRAKRGEQIFLQNCTMCHGQYQKAWPNTDTTQVLYHATTPVVDVGTNPNRHQGMQSLEDALNPLNFSQKYNIVIQTQTGYVPPPLEGIWARYPYLHNNSIPNLCALMTPPESRPTQYYSGEANSTTTDYDSSCVGYPLDAKTPAEWKTAEHLYDTAQAGMSNAGHYDGIFRTNGVEKFTQDQKMDLIEFLKTL